MDRSVRFDEPYLPVPASALDADPAATIRELFFRVAKLEQSIQEERVRAAADVADILLVQIALSDAITEVVESVGVPSTAADAILVRKMTTLGQKCMGVLNQHQVVAIDTLGKPVDPECTDVVDHEVRADLPDGTVLREVETGYRWRSGVLRRAQVVVSVRSQASNQDIESA